MRARVGLAVARSRITAASSAAPTRARYHGTFSIGSSASSIRARMLAACG
ncbi:MAG: hypothetical protein WKG00_10635 [Polyangiaceae bacterium]